MIQVQADWVQACLGLRLVQSLCLFRVYVGLGLRWFRVQVGWGLYWFMIYAGQGTMLIQGLCLFSVYVGVGFRLVSDLGWFWRLGWCMVYVGLITGATKKNRQQQKKPNRTKQPNPNKKNSRLFFFVRDLVCFVRRLVFLFVSVKYTETLFFPCNLRKQHSFPGTLRQSLRQTLNQPKL